MADPSIDAARRLFSPENAYLNTASYGLPPRTAFDALAAAADEWRHGRTGFDGWDRSVGAARASFARLAGVHVDDVAVGSAVSAFAGLVAATLPAGARVLCAEGDFTSVLFPFLAQEARGVAVELVTLDRLPEAIGAGHDLVAVSAVQSVDGKLADLDAIAAAAAHHDVRTFIDTTQAMGWLPLDCSRFDYTACAGYKWLLGPRGTAFFTIRPARRDELVPHAAGWYAGEDVPGSYYGAPLRLAAARAASTSRPHGCAGSAPRPRSRCSRSSARTRSTRTTSGSPTACATGSGWGRAGRRSCRSRGSRTARGSGWRRRA